MGTDKALAEVGGRPLALRVAEAVRRTCPRVSIVGDPAKYSHLGLPVIPDSFHGLGPLAGIEAALAATNSDWNLVVACDMPSLDQSLLESLFSMLESHPATDPDCVLPVHPDGTVEPLCAVYHRRALPVIRAALESGIRKVTDALRPLAVTYVAAGSAAPYANLNTPEDLRKYLHG